MTSGTPKDGKNRDASPIGVQYRKCINDTEYKRKPIQVFLDSISSRCCHPDGPSDIFQHRVLSTRISLSLVSNFRRYHPDNNACHSWSRESIKSFTLPFSVPTLCPFPSILTKGRNTPVIMTIVIRALLVLMICNVTNALTAIMASGAFVPSLPIIDAEICLLVNSAVNILDAISVQISSQDSNATSIVYSRFLPFHSRGSI